MMPVGSTFSAAILVRKVGTMTRSISTTMPTVMISRMIDNWNIVLLGVFAAVGLFLLIGRTKRGRYAFDRYNVTVSLFGRIRRDVIASRFARAFGVLLASGMDVVEAMEKVSIILGNKYVEAKFKEATEAVRRGVSLTAALSECKFFPPILLQMVAIGERTNSLESVLSRSCGFFDTQVESSLSNLTARIQPIMLFLLGGVVIIMFVAVYSPMLSIMDGLSTRTY